uniref:Fibronectin type-III domain-containing protein n=1 Tax=Periophthalmus magnuspinnatus TaxID=409849 RepID=A0A3B4BH38_9GOBI
MKGPPSARLHGDFVAILLMFHELFCIFLSSLYADHAGYVAAAPAAPVNVSVSQLRADSALVTWSIPQGDTVIGYALSQQRQDGLMQRSIREVNTSSHWCMLWDLDEDTHYSVQVQSVGTQGDSQPSRAVHFRTLERTSLNKQVCGDVLSDEPAMEGLGMTPHLQTGELLIITTVLLLWAAVIALFCRQYDIIKDNDSNGTKEKGKRLRSSSSYYNGSTGSSPIYHNGAVRSSRVRVQLIVYIVFILLDNQMLKVDMEDSKEQGSGRGQRGWLLKFQTRFWNFWNRLDTTD